jgi:release factor glutamine methyltransferase
VTACHLARGNARAAGQFDRVEVHHGLAESLTSTRRFVLIIVDPPWVPTRRVTEYPDDPPWAIDGGSDGLDVVRALLAVIERHLYATGVVLLQVGDSHQVDQVRKLLKIIGSTLCVAESRSAPDGEIGAMALLVHRRSETT